MTLTELEARFGKQCDAVATDAPPRGDGVETVIDVRRDLAEVDAACSGPTMERLIVIAALFNRRAYVKALRRQSTITRAGMRRRDYARCRKRLPRKGFAEAQRRARR